MVVKTQTWKQINGKPPIFEWNFYECFNNFWQAIMGIDIIWYRDKWYVYRLMKTDTVNCPSSQL